MSSTNSLDGTATLVPLLGERQGEGRECHEEKLGWWKKVVSLDMVEVKQQSLFALPMVVTNASYYLVLLISVMFAGRLGQRQLAGSTLANSWSFVSGFSFMVGISGAVETLCGQAYGAKTYHMMGIYLQATCIISFLFAVIISIVWWYTEPVLILLQQSPEVAREAATYIRYLIPGLFAYGGLQNVLRFVQTQSVVLPLVFCSLVPLALHLGLNYVLVHLTPLGYRGAPLAASITFWISVIMLSSYVKYSKSFEHTWSGLSKESFRHIIPTLPLAVPSAAMVCLEYWAFEVLVLLAGLMPNPEKSTSLMAMCVNTSGVAFNFLYGLSAAVSTRVSNELGANRVDVAKNATWVTLKLTFFVAIAIIFALGFGHNVWAGFFSDNIEIIEAFASMTPFVCCSLFVDSLQVTLQGVSRGCGWQKLVMCINLGVYYLIALPISAVLGYVFKLYVKGLWIGIIFGLICQCSGVLLITVFRKWTKYEYSHSGGENSVLV